MPQLGGELWDTSFVLSDYSLVGRLLHTLVGYTAQPSGIQVVFYVAVPIVIGGLMRAVGRRPPSDRSSAHPAQRASRLQPGE